MLSTARGQRQLESQSKVTSQFSVPAFFFFFNLLISMKMTLRPEKTSLFIILIATTDLTLLHDLNILV